MSGNVTFSRVSNAEHIASVLLKMFHLLGIYIFDPRFYYNTFLLSVLWFVSNCSVVRCKSIHESWSWNEII